MKCRNMAENRGQMVRKHGLGRLGEATAAQHLQKQGFTILERNYRYLKAEIDLIARKNDLLLIVEVKTRSGTALEGILEAVNRQKRNRLIMAADYYINSKGLRVDTRFDIIWITRKGKALKVKHIPDAFYHF